MSQRWSDLLFAHWSIAADAIAPWLPLGLDVDLFDGSAWIGVVPFSMDQVRTRLGGNISVAVPWASKFAELNLRTYVRSRTTGLKGVYFFSLDAASLLAVLGARILFHLPYFWADMETRTEASLELEGRRVIWYKSLRRRLYGNALCFQARYGPTGPPAPPSQSGTLAHFLTERYCLFTQRRGRVLVGHIHHLPWQLQPAEAEITTNDLAAPYEWHLPDVRPILHFSRELRVYVWPLAPEDGSRRSRFV